MRVNRRHRIKTELELSRGEAPAANPRLDCLGDPLPPGCADANGDHTTQTKSALIRHIAYSADGKSIVTDGDDGISACGTPRTRLLRQIAADVETITDLRSSPTARRRWSPGSR